MAGGVAGFDPHRLKAARTAAGYTQAELAEELGIARTNYIPYEATPPAKTRTPSPATLACLADILQVAPRQLLEGEDEQGPSLAALGGAAGYTQAELAEELGIARTTYLAIEHGNKPISGELASVLAAMLDVETSEIHRTYRREESTRR